MSQVELTTSEPLEASSQSSRPTVALGVPWTLCQCTAVVGLLWAPTRLTKSAALGQTDPSLSLALSQTVRSWAEFNSVGPAPSHLQAFPPDRPFCGGACRSSPAWIVSVRLWTKATATVPGTSLSQSLQVSMSFLGADSAPPRSQETLPGLFDPCPTSTCTVPCPAPPPTSVLPPLSSASTVAPETATLLQQLLSQAPVGKASLILSPIFNRGPILCAKGLKVTRKDESLQDLLLTPC